MNHLAEETSPYLLQHAHNPVDWYAWKPEAFERARTEDKPILVSIGYSTCHWCHVMERESFEDERTAAYMNEHFINIKVDREERPDVDQIYMEAVQVLSGSGGWPLNCFLTPEGKPFFGGTYYPPEPRHNRPSWPQVLQHIRKVFAEQRDVVEEQANKLLKHVEKASSTFVKSDLEPELSNKVFTEEVMEQICKNLSDRFDREEGGFGAAPKFPNTMALRFLLHYDALTGNETARRHALFSIDRMIQGGIFDQLGGGFARYTTDRAWLIPHFEKMLYDNALLVALMADAWRATKADIYKEAIEETLSFIEREMTGPQVAFYAALDADSEGEEGKFYVWNKAEVDELLGNDSALFCAFYDISSSGNWEGHNILWREYGYATFAEANDMEVGVLKEKLAGLRQILLERRAGRIRPGLDDKVLLSWNALQCIAYAEAGEALDRDDWRKKAEESLRFCLKAFKIDEGLSLQHTLKFEEKEGGDVTYRTQYDAFLDDYAYLIKAILSVYRLTFDKDLLHLAKAYTDHVLEAFSDEEQIMFYYTSNTQGDLVLRKKEVYDGATPSGNAIMVENLQLLALAFGSAEYEERAQRMLLSVQDAVRKYPSSFAQWAIALLRSSFPPKEVAIVGDDY
ncbi:MAG: thioredoxin domain-containing protein, partial [Bacteroidota bacterium]